MDLGESLAITLSATAAAAIAATAHLHKPLRGIVLDALLMGSLVLVFRPAPPEMDLRFVIGYNGGLADCAVRLRLWVSSLLCSGGSEEAQSMSIRSSRTI
jgi:hypothetical protein